MRSCKALRNRFVSFGDANVVVVSKAAQALGLLAKGLRKEFTGAKIVFPVLLDKMKEKKNAVLEAIHTCLDSMFDGCFALIDVMEGNSIL